MDLLGYNLNSTGSTAADPALGSVSTSATDPWSFDSLFNALGTAANNAATSAINGLSPTQQPAAAPKPKTVFGVPTSMLLLVGGAVVVFFLLTHKK